MTEAPASLLFRSARKRTPAAGPERPTSSSAWSSESARPVEIVAPDRYCTAVLLEYAGPLFPAEIVPGDGWIVRLQPAGGTGWVLELISLVERWLEYVRLPCAKVLYGGRSYLIRASADIAQFRTAPESAPSRSTELLTG